MAVAERAPRTVVCQVCGTPRALGEQCMPCKDRRARVVRAHPETRRLIADRWRRIWQMAERIAAEPGLTRAELATLFNLSERQCQADLTLIRDALRLPLVRRAGYRFVDEGWSGQASAYTLEDALDLFATLRDGIKAAPREHRIDSLVAKLPAAFPPHLRPLVSELAQGLRVRPSQRAHSLSAVAGAIVRGQAIRVRQPYGSQEALRLQDVVVRPAILLPLHGHWYAIGAELLSGRHEVIVPLADATVTLEVGRD